MALALPWNAVSGLAPPSSGDDWIGLSAHALPVALAAAWVVLPRCGAVVLFSGTSRDHSGSDAGERSGSDQERREGVTVLEYEAYDAQVVPRLRAIVSSMRQQWPGLGRIVLLHRTGEVAVGESSVVVVVSAAHREEAFAAGRFGIDAVKATVPIWKKETWDGGSAWALDAKPITAVDEVAGSRHGVGAA